MFIIQAFDGLNLYHVIKYIGKPDNYGYVSISMELYKLSNDKDADIAMFNKKEHAEYHLTKYKDRYKNQINKMLTFEIKEKII